jgi:hypothetical protein
MLCYVVLCYVVLCYVMLRYVMLCYVAPDIIVDSKYVSFLKVKNLVSLLNCLKPIYWKYFSVSFTTAVPDALLYI